MDASLHTPLRLCCPWAWEGFLALAVAVGLDGFDIAVGVGAVAGTVAGAVAGAVAVVVQADHFCL